MRNLPSEIPVCTPGDPPETLDEALAIIQAEYEYWRNLDCDGAIFATGAIANIFAAIKIGMRAPWHPKPNPKDE